MDTSSLHCAIIKHFLEHQHAPPIDELAVQFRQPRAEPEGQLAGKLCMVLSRRRHTRRRCTITTTLGAETRQVTVRIENGRPGLEKWSGEEAKALFERFGLTRPTWDIPTNAARF